MFEQVKYVPLISFGILIVTCSITYPLSIHEGHIPFGNGYSLVPFISSTIDHPPESCIGGFGLSLAAIGLAITMIAKNSLLSSLFGTTANNSVATDPEGILQKPSTKKLRILLVLSLICGISSAIGLIGVACFQYTNLPKFHLFFVFIIFGGGAIHLGLVTYIEHHLVKRAKSASWIGKLRLLFAICFIIFAPPTASGMLIHSTTSQTIAAISELTTVTFYAAFLLTEFADLKNFKFSIIAQQSLETIPLVQ